MSRARALARLATDALARVSAATIPLALFTAGCTKADSAQKPTWSEDVAPLVAEHCVDCHRQGGAAFSLESYDSARSYGKLLGHDVTVARMPPWPPTRDGGCPSFIGDRRLAQADIDLVNEWVGGGMPEGKKVPPISKPTSFGVLEDISVEVGPDAPFTPTPGGDDYHCYLVDPGLTHDAFVTAYRVAAGPAVHHLQIWELSNDTDAQKLATLDAQSPEPGFDCTVWPGEAVKQLSVWGPSDPVRRHPAGTGIRVHAGKKLILQVHYHLASGPDQTHVGLQLKDHVDHEASLIDLAPGPFTLPPRQLAVPIHTSIAITAPYVLWGVRGHMHSLGSKIHLDKDGPSGPSCVLAIDDWNPDWQLMYFYEQPLHLLPGDTVNLDCTYNTMAKDTPVHDGITATDEMCNGYLYVTDDTP